VQEVIKLNLEGLQAKRMSRDVPDASRERKGLSFTGRNEADLNLVMFAILVFWSKTKSG
jgi:hypothetical protein